MSKALLIFLFCLFSGAAAAQNAPVATARPAARASVAGYDDTLRAIGNLFERRRRGGRNWLIVSGLGALTTLRFAAGSTTQTAVGSFRSSPQGGAVALVLAVYAGVPAGIGIGKLVRFSDEKQIAIEDNYRRGEKLPPSINRRLRKKSFRR